MNFGESNLVLIFGITSFTEKSYIFKYWKNIHEAKRGIVEIILCIFHILFIPSVLKILACHYQYFRLLLFIKFQS